MHISHQILKAGHNLSVYLCALRFSVGWHCTNTLVLSDSINSVIIVLIVCWLAVSSDLCSACASSTDSEGHCHTVGLVKLKILKRFPDISKIITTDTYDQKFWREDILADW